MKDRLAGYQIAHAQLAAGQLEAARKYLASRSDSDAEQLEYLELWAAVAWHSRDLDELRQAVSHLSNCRSEHAPPIRSLAMARIEFYTANYVACVEHTSAALSRFITPRADLLAEILRWEGLAWQQQGDFHAAEKQLRASLRLWRDIDRGKEAECLTSLGTLARTRLQFRVAIQCYDQAIRHYDALHQPSRALAPITSRALLLIWQGRETQGLRDLRTTLKSAKRIGDEAKTRDSLLVLGYAQLKCGQLPEAEESLLLGWRLNRDQPDHAIHRQSFCIYFAELRIGQGRIGSAGLWLREASRYTRNSDALHTPRALLHLREGDPTRARHHATKGVLALSRAGDGPDLAVAQRVLAQAYLDVGDARKSASVLRSARRTLVATESGSELARVESLIWEAWYHRRPVSVHPAFPGIVTRNRDMLEVLDRGERISRYSTAVAIYGETGTGKELVAHGIHRSSPRKNRPFVALNCATAHLFEADLFGYVKGAFTGAAANRAGLARAADGGTLFLDEVAELTIEQQAKLLRFLDHGEVRPVGSDETFPVNVRVLCATNRDLRKMVGEGKFRSDLLYRLEEMVLTLPPVRERRDDIPILLLHLIDRAAKRLERPRITIHPHAMESLRAHSWPGNLRDLQSLALRFVDQGEHVRTWTAPVIAASGVEITKERLASVLEATGHNVSATAAQLGLHRSRLYRLKKRWGL